MPKVSQSWECRMAALNENWDNCRSELFKAVISEEGLHNQVCHVCKTNIITIRCYSCHGKRFCTSCDLIIHEDHPFHDRDAFMNGFFQAVPPTHTVGDNGDLVNTSMFINIYL